MVQAYALRLGALVTAIQQFGGRIEQAWKAYWTGRARRATVLLLKSLDTRTLKDIGIDRSEIESVVYGCPDDRRR